MMTQFRSSLFGILPKAAALLLACGAWRLAAHGQDVKIQGTTGLDLPGIALLTEIANTSSPGTTANKLVILVNSGGASQARTATVSSTTGVEGICLAVCTT